MVTACCRHQQGLTPGSLKHDGGSGKRQINRTTLRQKKRGARSLIKLRVWEGRGRGLEDSLGVRGREGEICGERHFCGNS